MRTYVGQIYITPGVSFGWTVEWQKYLSERLNNLISSSAAFETRFGAVKHLIFRISAKRGLVLTEIRGPTHYKRARDVEMSLFLPFPDLGGSTKAAHEVAMKHLLEGVCEALQLLGLSGERVQLEANSILDETASRSEFFGRK